MKKLLILSLLLLSSCALVDAYRMAKFDNNEYGMVANIRTWAQLGAVKCGTNDVVGYVDAIYVKSVELKNYSASIPRNEETVKMTEDLSVITKGLYDRYHSGDEVSTPYCNLKFNNIETSTSTMQKVIGAKPR